MHKWEEESELHGKDVGRRGCGLF